MPYVQQQLSIFLSKQLSATLKSDLRIEKVYIGFLNRIVIEGLELNDLSGKEMLKVTRLSAKFDILPLFKKQISISNIQLFGFNAALEKQTPESLPNYHFILDALASQDTTKRNDDLHLRINSLLIRRGEISYDVRSEKKTPGKFNPDHLHFNNIIATTNIFTVFFISLVVVIIIIIDDGDNTREIAERNVRRYNTVFIFRQMIANDESIAQGKCFK